MSKRDNSIATVAAPPVATPPVDDVSATEEVEVEDVAADAVTDEEVDEDGVQPVGKGRSRLTPLSLVFSFAHDTSNNISASLGPRR